MCLFHPTLNGLLHNPTLLFCLSDKKKKYTWRQCCHRKITENITLTSTETNTHAVVQKEGWLRETRVCLRCKKLPLPLYISLTQYIYTLQVPLLYPCVRARVCLWNLCTYFILYLPRTILNNLSRWYTAATPLSIISFYCYVNCAPDYTTPDH